MYYLLYVYIYVYIYIYIYSLNGVCGDPSFTKGSAVRAGKVELAIDRLEAALKLQPTHEKVRE